MPCGAQLLNLKEQIVKLDRMIMAWHRSNETSKRLHFAEGGAGVPRMPAVASASCGHAVNCLVDC